MRIVIGIHDHTPAADGRLIDRLLSKANRQPELVELGLHPVDRGAGVDQRTEDHVAAGA